MGNVRRPAMHMAAVMASSLVMAKLLMAGILVMAMAVMAKLLASIDGNMYSPAMHTAVMDMLRHQAMVMLLAKGI